MLETSQSLFNLQDWITQRDIIFVFCDQTSKWKHKFKTPLVFPNSVNVGDAVSKTETDNLVCNEDMKADSARLPAWLNHQSTFIFLRDFMPGDRQNLHS